MGEIIGQAIAAGVVLATDDFASSGHYRVDDDAESTFRLRQLGGRHLFDRAGRAQPFIGGRIGQIRLEQQLDFGNAAPYPLDFDVTGLALEGGVHLDLRDGWFSELRGEVGYAFAKSRLRDAFSSSGGEPPPILTSPLFTWDAEAVTLESGAAVGWRRIAANGRTSTVAAELVALHTDPVETDDPLQDVSVTTRFGRLSADFRFPLGGSLFGSPLSLHPHLRHTVLGSELAAPLDTDSFTDLRIALLSLWPSGRDLPFSAVGVAASYTTSESFEGWSVGIAIDR